MKRRIMVAVWMSLVLISMLYGWSNAHAAPLCLPGSATSDQPGDLIPHLYIDYANKGGGYYIYCDVGHKWQVQILAIGTLSEISPSAAMDAIKAAVTPAQQQALLDHIDAAANLTALDAQFIAAIKALPLPTVAPPSGWVTQTTDTYKQSPVVGGYKLTKLSAEPLPAGQACNAAMPLTDDNGVVYHALVDKSKVVMKKVGNYLPPAPSAVYARCVP